MVGQVDLDEGEGAASEVVEAAPRSFTVDGFGLAEAIEISRKGVAVGVAVAASGVIDKSFRRCSRRIEGSEIGRLCRSR